METEGTILMKKYHVGKVLGQGTSGKVYCGRNLGTGENVAIKVIEKEKVLKYGLVDQTKREISVMRLVKHPNIVQLHEVMATKTRIYFAIEYAKGGELFDKVANGRLEEDVARKYFQQLLSAVHFCHSRGVYHRDLKPENLLLDENGNLKVSDFGLSALAESKRQDGLLHTTCGTPAYVAPEVIRNKGYDGAKADIWSCGVILFVLLAGYLPFQNSNLMEMYRKISKAEYKCPNWFPPEVRKLLSRILDPNPNSRISIERIMANCWFQRGWHPRPAFGHPVKLPIVMDAVLSHPKCNNVVQTKLTNLNAFDIISLSNGFDLSGLFVNSDQKDDVRFTSTEPASSIMVRLDGIASRLRLLVAEKDLTHVKLEQPSGTLSIEINIFQITPTFHLVEMEKSSGDSIEYQHLLSRDIKPALWEIVWAWQGEQRNSCS